MKYISRLERNEESVKPINPCKSVMQTSYDIEKSHSGAPPVPFLQLSGVLGSYGDESGNEIT